MPDDYVYVGDYRLEETLGVGSFGRVKCTWLVGVVWFLVATHQLTKIKVAIKILSKEKIKQLNMWSKVRREIQILQKFKHPHIVRL